MGWVPDLPDPRDFTFRHEAIAPLLRSLRPAEPESKPDQVDLRRDDEGDYFTPPEDQGPLNSSPAFAVLSLVEYFERRLRGQTFDGSKRFLYKVARNAMHKRCNGIGDVGADLRTTLKVLTTVGVPRNEFWPYDIERFDDEPTQFVYSFAKRIPGLRYFRLDEPNTDGDATWETVTAFLAAGFPVVFGFSVPRSLNDFASIPYRADLDSVRGGQAVVAVGYRTDHFGTGQHALLIRCSWGREWGENGNGWLPVAYLRNQLARDFWTLLNDKLINCKELSCPRLLVESGAEHRTQ